MKVAQKWWMNRIFWFQLILKGLNGSRQEVIESCFLLKNSTHSRIKFLPKFLKLPNNCQLLRKLHFPSTKNRWEKPGAKCWTLGSPKPELPAWATWKSPAFIHPRWWSQDFSINSVFQLLQFPDPQLCRHLMRTLSSIYLKHLPSWKCSKWKSVHSTDYGASAVYLRVPTFTPPKLPNLSIWSFTATWKKHVN